MSRLYRYVVFAAAKQPTVAEVAMLQDWAAQSSLRYAVGLNAENGSLAIAFEAAEFERTRATHTEFAKLLQQWQVRGCEVVDKLPFIKNSAALRPLPGSKLHEAVDHRSEPVPKGKQLVAQEALGRAGLKLHQTLEQHAWLERVAKGVPYALIGLGGLLTLAAGVYFGQRLLDSPAERRQQTIKRVAEDAMAEPLVVRPQDVEAHSHDARE
jgi:hypothetical protein